MKMLIALDEGRVRAEGIYDLGAMWSILDATFAEIGCAREEQADGAVLYAPSGESGSEERFRAVYRDLSNTEWFGQYCMQWIWTDERGAFDVLLQERAANPLFAAWL